MSDSHSGENAGSGVSADAVREFLLGLQNSICSGLESLDGKGRFHEDSWQRERGGSGITRVISDGHVFEKGGVNFSHVSGDGGIAGYSSGQSIRTNLSCKFPLFYSRKAR